MEAKYLYCINDRGEDFITTSFEFFSRLDLEFITIFNFNQEFDIKKSSHIIIDYTLDILSGIGKKYKNSNNLMVYESIFCDLDIDRKIATIQVIKADYNIDLVSYKRDIKIKSIILP